MTRVNAVAYNSNAVLAGTLNGVAVGQNRHGHGKNAVQVAGVSLWEDIPEPTGCLATTNKGTPCKAGPVKGTSLCVGHTRQAAM
jgi:hypothetical protein